MKAKAKKALIPKTPRIIYRQLGSDDSGHTYCHQWRSINDNPRGCKLKSGVSVVATIAVVEKIF
jgi:hypothetical protein